MSRISTTRWWRGFTLVEMLVVLAILAVLVGMLLSAIQKVRESASRVCCMNNLRQLTIAMQDFGDQHGGTLPPAGGVPDYKLGRTWVYASSLHYFLLPYLEQNPLFLTGRWGTNYTPGTDYPDGSNTGRGTPTYWSYLAGIQYGTMPKLFQAPGDPTQGPGGGWTGADGTSYIHNGLAFPHEERTKFPSSFPDGTSQTIFFAEGYAVTNRGSYWRSWWRHTHASHGDPWSPNYIANPGDNPPFQTLPTPAAAQWYLPQGLSSAGIGVGMGDGSFRIVNRDVSPKTWYAANTPDGGDALGDDW
jgi:prepilin-type N-terminal cleavage/methylation domain-containing protein